MEAFLRGAYRGFVIVMLLGILFKLKEIHDLLLELVK